MVGDFTLLKQFSDHSDLLNLKIVAVAARFTCGTHIHGCNEELLRF